ncbi:MAG: DUF1444 family protein [bacterium]|nr:DUF1444 family protein [bacterium]
MFRKSPLTKSERKLFRSVLEGRNWAVAKESRTHFECEGKVEWGIRVDLKAISEVLKESNEENKRDVLEKWITGIEAELTRVREGKKRLEDLRMNLKPLADIIGMMSSIPEEMQGKVEFIFEGLSEDVVRILVLDSESRMQFVTTQDLEKWQIKEEDAVQQGFANLSELAGTAWIEEMEKGVFRIKAEDTYDAARILIPGIREKVEKRLGAEPRWAIPTRDYLLVCRKDNPQGIKAMEELAERIRDEGPYELSPNVFRMTEDGNLVAVGKDD